MNTTSNVTNATAHYLSWHPETSNSEEEERTIFCVLIAILVKLLLIMYFKPRIRQLFRNYPSTPVYRKNHDVETCKLAEPIVKR